VASLGWVTPGAAGEGVTPLFFPANLATFFAHSCYYHYRFLLFSLGCHPPRGCHPTSFYLSNLVSPLFLVNLPTIFFLRVSPPWKVSPGAVPPPPPSDATGDKWFGDRHPWLPELTDSIGVSVQHADTACPVSRSLISSRLTTLYRSANLNN